MKNQIIIYVLAVLLICAYLPIPAIAGIQTSTNGKIILNNNGKVCLQGNWTNNGVFTPNTGTIIFQGTSQDTILMASPDTLHNLTVTKSGGGFLELKSDITIEGTLELRSGTLYTNSGGRDSRSDSRQIVPSESRHLNKSDSRNISHSREVNASSSRTIEFNVPRSRTFDESVQSQKQTCSHSRPLNHRSTDNEKKLKSISPVEEFLFSDSRILEPEPRESREREILSQSRRLVEENVSRNERANGALTMADASKILRETGSLSNSPTFANSVDVEYGGSIGVTTGFELPLSTTALRDLIINNSGDVTLGADVTVNDSLIFLSGDLITCDYQLTLASGGVFHDPTNTGDIVGNAEATFDVGGGSVGDFSELGVIIGTGTDNLGSVTVTRTTGDAGVVTVGANSSIKCYWVITSDNPPSNGRDLTFQWDSSLDNGKDLTIAQVYKSDDGGSSWIAFGDQQDISGAGDPRSMTVNTTSFSDWTVSDGDNPLPIELANFYAETVPGSIILHWRTESEYKNAGFHVYRDDMNISGLIEGAGITSEAQDYVYVDTDVEPGETYRYKISDIHDETGVETFHPEIVVLAADSEGMGDNIPKQFALYANYPNPFNPQTMIKFDLPKASDVNIKIYDVTGRLVRTLVSDRLNAAYHEVIWNGRDDNGQNISSGTYIYKMITDDYTESKQMILLK